MSVKFNRQGRFVFLGIFVLFSVGLFLKGGQIPSQLSDSDVNTLVSAGERECSFFAWEGEKPELQISGWEREGERTLLKEGDVVYLNGGSSQGIIEDQVHQVLEFGRKLGNAGQLVHRRGRVRVTRVNKENAEAVLEYICGIVRVGDVLVPHTEQEGLLGKDRGFNVAIQEDGGIQGRFLFLQDDFVQLGPGHKAIIDLGNKDGIRVGDQILVCRRNGKNQPLRSHANAVVMDVQENSATVKILSSRDPVRSEDIVIIPPSSAF